MQEQTKKKVFEKALFSDAETKMAVVSLLHSILIHPLTDK